MFYTGFTKEVSVTGFNQTSTLLLIIVKSFQQCSELRYASTHSSAFQLLSTVSQFHSLANPFSRFATHPRTALLLSTASLSHSFATHLRTTQLLSTASQFLSFATQLRITQLLSTAS